MDFQYWKLPLGRECRFLKPAKKKSPKNKKKITSKIDIQAYVCEATRYHLLYNVRKLGKIISQLVLQCTHLEKRIKQSMFSHPSLDYKNFPKALKNCKFKRYGKRCPNPLLLRDKTQHLLLKLKSQLPQDCKHLLPWSTPVHSSSLKDPSSFLSQVHALFCKCKFST